MPWLLLPYATTTQALSATTAQVINGTQPYLTFNNGVTKATDTNSLLGITLSDGTVITPATNTSTETNPIKLPNDGDSFADIGMFVPPTTNSIALNALIGAPYNYWKDDDGDGQGINGATASGSLNVSITDSKGQIVGRSDVLSTCSAPYKVVLSSLDGNLTTQYGVPNSSIFSSNSATYYLEPKSTTGICYARPSLEFGDGNSSMPDYPGPANIWSKTKGFLTQSTSSLEYSRNFPTTAASDMHFDLDLGSIDPLTWPTVSKGGITATITPSPNYANGVRVTFSGPKTTSSQWQSDSPGRIDTPNLPQTFELVGYDSNNRAVVKYGFVLKQWFINRGVNYYGYFDTLDWCSSLGYRIPKVKELTNALCPDGVSMCAGAVGAKPSSPTNHYQRNIGAGFFTEWGYLPEYVPSGFDNFVYWTSDIIEYNQFCVEGYYGSVSRYSPAVYNHGICVYP